MNINDFHHHVNSPSFSQAVQGQYELCANILLENHADPNLVDTEGNSALHLASSIPSVSTVDALVDHDADIDAQNKVIAIIAGLW